MLAAATATIAGSHSTEAAMIQNQITIEVIPTLAPNAFGSPNFAAWEANTTAALDNGFSTFGSGAAQFDALANNATTKGNTVSYTVGGKYKVEGTINKQGQVEKVRTWFDQSIVGDMLVETTYSGYKDFGGVTYPSRMVQTQDGFPALDITVSAVMANPAVTIDVPQNVRAFQPAAVRVESQKMGEGVYYLSVGGAA